MSKLGCLAIFALISSCGGPGEGPPDTADVAAETRAETRAETGAGAPAAEDPPANQGSLVEEGRLVGFAGTRFIVFDTAERTVVLDTATEQAFGVYGHAVTEENSSADPSTDAGFSPSGIGSRVVASDDGLTMLVKTSAGIHAVDLEHRGALLTGWRGEAESATVAPDGSMFAVRTTDAIHLVRIGDGARSRYAYRSPDGSAPVIGWTAGAAYWSDADGARIVERSSFTALHVPMSSADVSASKDGRTFVVSRPGSDGDPGLVEVWRIGATKPRSKIVSAFVDQVTIEDDGSRIAWAETSGEYAAPMFLHTLDLATGVHARFSAHGHCSIGVERIVGFEDGDLLTDAECSPGCPSLPSQAQLIAYDFHSGKKLRERSGELVPPYNEELVRRMNRADELRAALSSSSGTTIDEVHFSPDGRWVVGAGDDGTLAVWDAANRKRIWASK